MLSYIKIIIHLKRGTIKLHIIAPSQEFMLDEDFLWECALQPNNGKDRLHIIPDSLDLALAESVRYPSKAFNCSKCAHLDYILLCDDNQVIASVLEERGSGVVDIIGGEVWEASLLLCGYIAVHLREFLVSDSVIELGSGVGLPALFLMHLLLLHTGDGDEASDILIKLKTVVMSDYDSRLLHNLERSLTDQFCTSLSTITHSRDPSLCIQHVDWTDSFTYPTFPESSVIMGSALCYAPSHAHALFDLIKHHLCAPCSGVDRPWRSSVERIVIIQIADREGFAELVRLLQEDIDRGASFSMSLALVEDEVFEYAQRVQRRFRGPAEDGEGIWVDYLLPTPHEGVRRTSGELGKQSASTGLIRTKRDAFKVLAITPTR